MVKKSTPKRTVRMLVDHDWKVPNRPAWIAFKAGQEYALTQVQFDGMVGLYEVVGGN